MSYEGAPRPAATPLDALPRDLPWSGLARALETAEESLARLDERLKTHPLAEGFGERAHFTDACAALWLEGELVSLEDLVLRDAHMDVRTATHATTRALSVLRARRLAARRDGAWMGSDVGIAAVRGGRPDAGNR